jgi:hypothetical protein
MGLFYSAIPLSKNVCGNCSFFNEVNRCKLMELPTSVLHLACSHLTNETFVERGYEDKELAPKIDWSKM